jgi:hypothetical protein
MLPNLVTLEGEVELDGTWKVNFTLSSIVKSVDLSGVSLSLSEVLFPAKVEL